MKIFSLIGNLAGGGGRVLNDVILGLTDHDNKVFYNNPLGMWSFGYGEELDALGVHHECVPRFEDFLDQYYREKPDIVLFHWWKGAGFCKPEGSKIPWVLICHTPLPMPIGYDYYVSTSNVNYEIQKHISRNKKTRIFNGIDLSKYKAKKTVRQKNQFVMGRVSHLKESKISIDYIDFVDSLDIPTLKQVIIGDGPMYQPLVNRVKELKIEDKFQFVKEVKNSELVDALEEFDISCYLTASHDETFSMVILNKLAMGIPIVTQPRGGNVDQVIHNRNGFLSYHESDLKRYCELLYKHDDLRARLSEGAIKSVKKFDIQIQHAAYRRLIEKLVKCC